MQNRVSFNEIASFKFCCFQGGRADEHLPVGVWGGHDFRRLLRRLPPECLLVSSSRSRSCKPTLGKKCRTRSTRVQRNFHLEPLLLPNLIDKKKLYCRAFRCIWAQCWLKIEDFYKNHNISFMKKTENNV